MAIMIPPEIPEVTSMSEKIIFETLKIVAQARDWTILHGVEIPLADDPTNSREIDFVILIPNILSVICLEVVRPSSKPATLPLDGAQDVMKDLKNHFKSSHFCSGSPLSLGYAVAFPAGRELKEEELPEHLSPIFKDAKLPEHLTLMTGAGGGSCDALDPDSLGVTLTSYAVELTEEWDPLSNLEELANGQMILDELRSDLVSTGTTIARIFHYNLETGRPQLLDLTDDQLISLKLMGCQLPSIAIPESGDQLNLESIKEEPRCVIDGAAGTGKTILALELAKQRCERGETVALLCCNSHLSRRFESWAQALPKNNGGKVLAGTPATLPLWAFRENPSLREQHQRRLTASPNLEESLKLGYLDTRDWQQFIRNTITDLDQIIDQTVATTEQEGVFDYLVVDEAQNLCDQMFLRLMDKMLKGGLINGHWSMFGDFTHQTLVSARLHDEGTAVLRRNFGKPLNWEEHKLTINCRNTYEIATTVAKFVRIDSPIKSGVHGPSVQIEYFESKEELGNQLDFLISGLKENQGFSSQQIILLTSTKHDSDGSDKFDFDTNRAYGGWELLNISDVKKTFIPENTERVLRFNELKPDAPLIYSDVYDFQGLESDVAILVLPVVTRIVAGRPILPNYQHRRRLLYTGMSRAKAKLIVVAQEPYRESLEPPGL